jgi:predicted neutral ceramidase superfamily lipid hydrolase
MNSSQRPNLFKYIVLVIAFVAASLTTVEVLILIYAAPVQPPTVFLFLSGLMTIAFIPYALLLLGLTKDYISIKKGSQEAKQN